MSRFRFGMVKLQRLTVQELPDEVIASFRFGMVKLQLGMENKGFTLYDVEFPLWHGKVATNARLVYKRV